MKRPPKIDIYWDNPPGRNQGATVRRIVAGGVYERRVLSTGLLSSTETAKALNITLRHLYNLVKDGKLKPVRKADRLYFRLSDIKRYLGFVGTRSHGSEPWLVN